MAASTSTTTDLSREELLAGLRALRLQFEGAGVTGMTLFGSRARGDNRPDSDVDLMIEVEDASGFSLLDLIHLQNLAEERLGVPTQITMRRSMDPRFRADIIAEEAVVF